ncbi:7-deoxyloganetic acid glucosyltransferase [Euphorbia peplus]|nr:7-deoxyloganetic acid glucosyltransferase [Euphorbia peplus]
MNNILNSPFVPHVLIFPAPGQGHVNSMLKLAEVLCLSGLNHITFVNFEDIHENLIHCSDIESRFVSKYPEFQFKTISNCFSSNDELGSTDPGDRLREFLDATKTKSKPILKKMLIESNPPVNYVIGDMLTSFVHDAATEVGIPCIQFHTISACAMWIFHSVPDIVAAHQLPIKGEDDMDRVITAVPGMETILRCRDLPKKFVQVDDISNPNLLMNRNEMREAESLILNTFEELEGPILSQIRNRYPKTYAIGPLHELLKAKLKSINDHESYSGSNSLLKVDRSCIDWLDKQPLHSVVYVSFGSITLMTRDQFMELWHGLANSNYKFLWVIRPDLLCDENDNVLETIPSELKAGPTGRGYIVSWAPQEEVLAHKAIGGFWTHSGWNSTLESVVAGVPMICWPYYGDQEVNSRFVSEVWKLGLDMKDTCDRKIVEKMVNDLMVDRREEFVKSAAKMAALARCSVEKGGSSACNLDSLIEEIKMMSMKNRKVGA